MKNKQAKKEKRKRKQKREAIKAAECKRIVTEVNAYRESIGKAPVDAKTIMRTYRECSYKYALGGVRTPIFVTMYILNKYYGYGHLRLFNYLKRVEELISCANTQMRSEHQFREDMYYDLKFDVTEMPDIYNMKNLSAEKVNLLHNCRVGLIFALYPFYFDMKWGKKRMKKLHEKVIDELFDAVKSDRIDEIKRILEKKAKLIFDGNSLSIRTPTLIIKRQKVGEMVK